MKRIALINLILLLGTVFAMARTDSTDTSATVTARKATLKATARIHSMGLFSYGGRLVSQNNVLDLNITYTRPSWGFIFFKAIDLRDNHTPINFALAAVNKRFEIAKNLTFTPHVGIVLEQFQSLADHGSDAAVFLVMAYRIQPHLTLEYTGMFGNLIMEPELRDWVNRLRLLYSKGHLDVTLFAWHNNQVFDRSGYGTVGLSVFVNRLPLAGNVTLLSGLTGLYMAAATDEKSFTGANGLFLTLGVTVN